jgi:two-component system, OmpR family, phosphate regulon sensor histidine kinase PhoR
MERVVVQGLVAPAVVAIVAAVAGLAGGAGWALLVLAVGAAAIVGLDLYHRVKLVRWAAGPLDATVPEGFGGWSLVFTALYRRMRLRKAQQRDLAQTIERFQKAAEAIPDGMVLLDGAGRIRWANQRARRYLGTSYPGDVGQPVTNFVRQPEIVRYVDSEDWSEPIVVESQREPGITLSIQLVPFGVEERLLISRDVSRFEAVEKMRRDFIANVSHELKTPLTVVSGFVETMQDVELGPDQRSRYLSLMHEQALSMQRLVSDLLTLSSLESDGNRLQEASVPVRPLMEELALDAGGLSHGRHEIVLEPGPAATITGSRDELKSAFGNLVSNAIRYTAEGGRIRLAWQVDVDGAGLFCVADSGIGIAPEHLPRLTERFYRVDRSRSRATGGTGLGLAIVKHVLLRHQSALEIESVPGQGSTFTVRIPPARVAASA